MQQIGHGPRTPSWCEPLARFPASVRGSLLCFTRPHGRPSKPRRRKISRDSVGSQASLTTGRRRGVACLLHSMPPPCAFPVQFSEAKGADHE